MRKGKRWCGGGLPDWPQVYVRPDGTVTVTGKHGTVPRYRLIRAVLKLTMLSGLLVIVVLGCSLLGKSDYRFGPDMFNPVQQYRLLVDHAVIRYAADHQLSWVFENRQYLLAEQRFTSSRLANAIWAAIAVIWFILFAILRAMNRPFLSGWIFARRTTVTITPTHVTLYRLRYFRRRHRRDEVATIQFKVESHPRLHRRLPVAPDIQEVYQDSGHLVMVYGSRIEPIAIIVGATAAGQFAICCETGLKLSSAAMPLRGKPGTVTVRVELE
jgi:hypothetical protein